MCALTKLKTVLSSAGTKGLLVPHAYDAADKKPSARLLFTYIAFSIAATSTVALHWYPALLSVTWTAIAFFIICTVLYMLRTLHSFKADLDDKSLEFESEADKKAPEEK